jgi:tricorn protease
MNSRFARLTVLGLAAALVLVALAGTAAFAQGTLLLRLPTVSATQIAFVYAEDIWTVSRDGGEARRLTTSPGTETFPSFSPDGKTLAFTGQYEGNLDVYVMPATGGEPTRLTYHPSADIVRGWTPDGKRIVFESARKGGPHLTDQLWTISPNGGMEEPLPIPQAVTGSFSPDAKYMAYVPFPPAYVAWRHYRGGRTTPIWLFDMANFETRKLPRDNSNDYSPMWIGDTVYFLSDRNGTMNLFAWKPGDANVEQLTHHTDYDVRSAGACQDAIVYEQAGYLHLFDLKTRQTRPLTIHCEADLAWKRPRYGKVNNMIHESDISPTGVRVVVEARGGIFTIPAKKGEVRNLTHNPGVNNRSPAWSPDGSKIVWLSDEGGEYHLVVGEQTGLKPTRSIKLPGPTFYYTPSWSPDSKKLTITDARQYASIVDVDAGTVTPFDIDRIGGGIQPTWSPDSQWIAYAKDIANRVGAIFLYSLKDKKSYRITDGLAEAASPVFDRGGKYLYFLASTDFGLHIAGMDMSAFDHHSTRGIYVMVLNSKDPSPFLPQSDDEEVKTEPAKTEETPKKGDEPKKADEPKKDQTPAKPAEAKKPDTPAPAKDDAAKKTAVQVVVDTENISQRILAIDLPLTDYSDLQPGPDADGFLYLVRVEGEPNLKLMRYDLKEREAKEVIKDINGIAVSADGKKMLYVAGSTYGIIDPHKTGKVGDGTVDMGRLEARIDPGAEWEQIFREGWRIQRDFLYDPKMQGENWQAMYDKYHPFVQYVSHRNDLNYLLAMLQGELTIGHSYQGGGDTGGAAVSGAPAGLLGADYAIENGRYRIKHIYSGENWNPDLRAPLTAPGIKVSEGDYLISVNGQEIAPPANLYRFFEGTANKQIVLRVSGTPSTDKAWDITVVPISDESALRGRDWIEDNRRTVDKLSGGKLAYVYVPDTSWGGYSYFNRYFFAQLDKQGAVIDERFNGGGKIADYIVDLLNRPCFGYFAPRNSKPFPVPGAAIFGPKVMLINEMAGSGGDALPYAFRARGIGPLVGTRTWGGLVGIGGYPTLIDGGYITAPNFAFYNTKGQWDVENVGVAPDIEVDQTPARVIRGEDPQLQAAVAECMRLLRQNPPVTLDRPAPIDRTSWKRTEGAK